MAGCTEGADGVVLTQKHKSGGPEATAFLQDGEGVSFQSYAAADTMVFNRLTSSFDMLTTCMPSHASVRHAWPLVC